MTAEGRIWSPVSITKRNASQAKSLALTCEELMALCAVTKHSESSRQRPNVVANMIH